MAVNYGVKYVCEFDAVSLTPQQYSLQILQKNYSGSVIRVIGGAAPVIHRWETDEPKSTIKGSSLELSLVNDGSFPLTDLYSVDDEEYKVILFWGQQKMFEGFMVQDDSSEVMADFTHEITLSANDNLGLLKDVPFNQAKLNYTLLSASTQSLSTIAPHTINVDPILGATLQVGYKIELPAPVAGIYTIQSISIGTTTALTVAEPVETNFLVTGDVAIYSTNLYDLKTLANIISVCLSSTGMELHTRVFGNIIEITQDPSISFIEQTLIDPQTFLNGSTYDDCYTVLTKVLDRFNFCLFQAKGFWNIVRWDEARYYDAVIPGFEFDETFNFYGTCFINDKSILFGGWPKFPINFDEATKAETGLLQRIVRPYNFTKETFNYRQPAQLLRNFDLQQIGVLLSNYTTGTGSDLHSIKEYAVPWWDIIPGSYIGVSNYFIRVTYDNLNNEIDRCLVLKNGSVVSFPIPSSQGDSFVFSFSVVTNVSRPGPANTIFEIKLTDGTNTRYLDEDTVTWKPTRGFNIEIPSGDDENQTHSFDIPGAEIPFDGNLTVSLMDFTGGTAETQYRDIRFQYTTMINKSTKVIGQNHTSTQIANTKNNEEHEIYIDNSPRNSIIGTLYLDALNGILQKRCTLWKRLTKLEEKNLGEITTFENIFLRRVPRTILEGTFYGLVNEATDHLSLLNVFRYTYFANKNFVFGRLEIDYRNNNATGSLYEMYKDNEQDSDVVYYYTFQFLYDSK